LGADQLYFQRSYSGNYQLSVRHFVCRGQARGFSRVQVQNHIHIEVYVSLLREMDNLLSFSGTSHLLTLLDSDTKECRLFAAWTLSHLCHAKREHLSERALFLQG
jgi:hypothetical protein